MQLLSPSSSRAFSAGSACFIPAGQRHCSRNPGDREAEVLWVLVEKG